MIYVYALYSKNYDRLYVGVTSNLEQRMLSHNKLGKGWTAKYRPWEILLVESYVNKKEALNRERMLKGGQGRAWLREQID